MNKVAAIRILTMTRIGLLQQRKKIAQSGEPDRLIRYQRFAMMGPDERPVISIPGFQREKIIAGSWGKLRVVNPQQLQFAFEHRGGVDNERWLMEFVNRIKEERSGFAGRIGVVERLEYTE